MFLSRFDTLCQRPECMHAALPVKPPRPLETLPQVTGYAMLLSVRARGSSDGALRPVAAQGHVITQDRFSAAGLSRESMPWLRQAVARMCMMKLAHSPLLMSSTGPCVFLESRTATAPGRLRATSTQLPPLSPLREDLRHWARFRSIDPQLLS